MKFFLKLLPLIEKSSKCVLYLYQSPNLRKKFLQRGIPFTQLIVSRKFYNSSASFDIKEETNKCQSLNKNKTKWGSKKIHRNIKLKFLQMMADPKIEEVLAPLREAVKEQVSKL